MYTPLIAQSAPYIQNSCYYTYIIFDYTAVHAEHYLPPVHARGGVCMKLISAKCMLYILHTRTPIHTSELAAACELDRSRKCRLKPNERQILARRCVCGFCVYRIMCATPKPMRELLFSRARHSKYTHTHTHCDSHHIGQAHSRKHLQAIFARARCATFRAPRFLAFSIHRK